MELAHDLLLLGAMLLPDRKLPISISEAAALLRSALLCGHFYFQMQCDAFEIRPISYKIPKIDNP